MTKTARQMIVRMWVMFFIQFAFVVAMMGVYEYRLSQISVDYQEILKDGITINYEWPEVEMGQ